MQRVKDTFESPELISDLRLIADEAGHSHDPADAHVLSGLGQSHRNLGKVVRVQTELGRLKRDLELKQNVDHTIIVCGIMFDPVEQLNGVDRVDHGHEWGYVLHLVGLQMTDHMPFHIGREQGMLVLQFLDPVLSKYALSLVVDGHDFFRRLCLGYGHEGNLPVGQGLLDFYESSGCHSGTGFVVRCMSRKFNAYLTILLVNIAFNNASNNKKVDMASKWETRENRTKRMAIILSVVLHIVVIAALSTGGSQDGGVKTLIESIFGGADDAPEQTAELEQS